METMTQTASAVLSTLINIRAIRKRILKEEFTNELFDSINGTDCALENLIGRSVMFGCLDEQQRIDLRQEIIRNLGDQEEIAVKKVASSLDMTKEFAPILDEANHVLTASLESLDLEKLVSAQAHVLTEQQVKDHVDSLESVTENIEAAIPFCMRVLNDGGSDPEAIPGPDKSQPDEFNEVNDAIAGIETIADAIEVEDQTAALAAFNEEVTLSERGFNKENIMADMSAVEKADRGFCDVVKRFVDTINDFAADQTFAHVYLKSIDALGKISNAIIKYSESRILVNKSMRNLIGAIAK